MTPGRSQRVSQRQLPCGHRRRKIVIHEQDNPTKRTAFTSEQAQPVRGGMTHDHHITAVETTRLRAQSQCVEDAQLHT
jgi:hypothetical protein